MSDTYPERMKNSIFGHSFADGTQVIFTRSNGKLYGYVFSSVGRDPETENDLLRFEWRGTAPSWTYNPEESEDVLADLSGGITSSEVEFSSSLEEWLLERDWAIAEENKELRALLRERNEWLHR